jgi:hypothetical protein
VVDPHQPIPSEHAALMQHPSCRFRLQPRQHDQVSLDSSQAQQSGGSLVQLREVRHDADVHTPLEHQTGDQIFLQLPGVGACGRRLREYDGDSDEHDDP